MFRLAYFPEFTIVFFVFPRLPSVVYKHANDLGPEMIPQIVRKMIPDRKWSPRHNRWKYEDSRIWTVF